ncbi:hypothetical protein GHCGIGKI_00120 [Klebsiella phage P01]|nr:hypothetical protein GHCGIGKI_00120 [Klebsiella phage P01]
MANKPTKPNFPLGLESQDQSVFQEGILNNGVVEHGPDAVMTVPETPDASGVPSAVRYNEDDDQFEGYYNEGGWLPLGGGNGGRWELLPHASSSLLQIGRAYLVDNTDGVSTVLFPSPKRVGDSITVCDLFGKFSTYPLTVDGNGKSIYGSADSMTISTDNVSATFTWTGEARGWVITSGVGLGQGRVYSREIYSQILSATTPSITLSTQPSIVDVYVDGKRLKESLYTLDGYEVKFDPALASGSDVQIVQYIPIQLGAGGGGSGGTVITWEYNGGSAIGGETQIVLDVVVDSVSEIYIRGSRQQIGRGFTFDPATSTITLADELEAGDDVVVVINGDPTVYNQIDRSPQEVARANNVKNSEVILSTDKQSVLDGKIILFDVSLQTSWTIPSGIPVGAKIVSVSSGVLTYSPGNVNINLSLVPRTPDMQYWIDLVNKKVLFSKLDGTSLLDQTSAFQSEVNSLTNGMEYYTPKGTIIARMVIFPTLANMVFNFKGTIFKRPNGVDPTDTDQIRFNRLNNCIIRGLYVDGNRDNLPVTGSDSNNLYGRVLGWRLGNNSSMCYFEDVTMVNQLYCGSQWGNNITKITIEGITYDMIGEHVFYISGKGGGSNKHLYFNNIKGGSCGINSNNADESHTCAFMKSAQSDATGAAVIGNDNDDFVITDIIMAQDVTPGYAVVAVINGYLNNLTVKNLTVGANVGGVLSPLGRADNVLLDGVKGSSDTVGCPLVFSYPSGVEKIDNWEAKNINLPGAYNQPHIQLFSLLENFVISRFTSSADQVSTVFSAGKRTILRQGIINSSSAASLLQYVARDFIFEDIVFNATISGSVGAIDYIGQNAYTDGARVVVKGSKFAHAGSYSVGIMNALAKLELIDCFNSLKQIYCRGSTALGKLTMDNVEMSASAQPPVVASKISVKALKNVVTSDGARDLTEYKNVWTIANGLTSIGYDLTNVLIGAVDARAIQVSPRTNLYGANKFWVTVSGNTVTINIDAAATAAISFNVVVRTGNQEA